jgi:hypothetical protein
LQQKGTAAFRSFDDSKAGNAVFVPVKQMSMVISCNFCNDIDDGSFGAACIHAHLFPGCELLNYDRFDSLGFQSGAYNLHLLPVE